METFSLKLKLVVIFNGAKLTLVKRLKNRQLLWVDELGEPVKMTEAEFYRLYDTRELFVDEEQPYLGVIPIVRNAAPDITCFPEKHSAAAYRRRCYLTRLIDCISHKLPPNNDLKSLIQQAAIEMDDPITPPSVSTIRRWILLFRTGSVVKLVPRHRDKGRSRIIVGELEEVVSDLVDTDYLTLERPLVGADAELTQLPRFY